MPISAAPDAKRFWQHSGEIVSSRLAKAVLEIVDRTCYENAHGGEVAATTETPSDDDHLQLDREVNSTLAERVAHAARVRTGSVFLYPTGFGRQTECEDMFSCFID